MSFAAPRGKDGRATSSQASSAPVEFASFKPRVQRILKGPKPGESALVAYDATEQGSPRAAFRPSSANPGIKMGTIICQSHVLI